MKIVHYIRFWRLHLMCSIYKIQGLTDICLGTINSGRPFSDLHTQIGMFVKTLPLRSKINSDQSFSELIHTVQEDLLAIDKHQDIPEDILNTYD